MNKKDILPIAIMILLIPVWLWVDRSYIAKKFPAKVPQPAVKQAVATDAPPSSEATATPKLPTTLSDVEKQEEIAPATATLPKAPAVEEQHITIGTEELQLELSSYGGGVSRATLLQYPKMDTADSEPVSLSFTNTAALLYDQVATRPMQIEVLEEGKSVKFSTKLNNGLLFERTYTVDQHYLVTISDRFVNQSGEAMSLDALRLVSGLMRNPEDTQKQRGVSILGADSYAGDSINYWGRKLNKLFKNKGTPPSLRTVPEEMQGRPVEWVAAKNKFFVQIIRPENSKATMEVLSTRDTNAKGIVPVNIAVALIHPEQMLEANEAAMLNYTYLIGPKKYSTLQASGYNMEKVMEFETIGFWGGMNWLMEPARTALLWTLNKFYSLIPNYGIAIILLTLLTRILFWPLTHKSTENMKVMQEIQPELKAIQAKYKDNPKMAQMKTMELYKERKFNPLGGCLPMFVQIPVFIALFTVLRNAIELRYAGFLWIPDLSTAENLFHGSIPVVGSLNILPLLMAGSMFWQQKLTPSNPAATPEQQAQQKMMTIMMPIMMLVFFYKMPSGLVLYWTTSQLLMILQISMRNRKKKAEA